MDNAVLRTDPALDAMVRHLGYEPVASGQGLRTDVELVQESQERLGRVVIVPDVELSPLQLASLMLARAIASLAPQQPIAVHAAVIPPASDRVHTAGMYRRGSRDIYISTDLLSAARSTMDTVLHELAHDTSGADDGDAAHDAEVGHLSSLAAFGAAANVYSEQLGDPNLVWRGV